MLAIVNHMVDYRSPVLDDAFHALADPTRRAILFQIAQKESTVSELAEPFNMSLAAVSKHLQVLEKARLVKKIKEGRDVRCQLNAEPLRDAAKLIQAFEAFWGQQLDSLERYFIEENEKRGEHHGNKVSTQSGRKKNNSGKTRKGL
jgi:DNA-binding transcriptional ArsR family regulator